MKRWGKLLAIVLLVTFVQFRGEKKWVNYM